MILVIILVLLFPFTYTHLTFGDTNWMKIVANGRLEELIEYNKYKMYQLNLKY